MRHRIKNWNYPGPAPVVRFMFYVHSHHHNAWLGSDTASRLQEVVIDFAFSPSQAHIWFWLTPPVPNWMLSAIVTATVAPTSHRYILIRVSQRSESRARRGGNVWTSIHQIDLTWIDCVIRRTVLSSQKDNRTWKKRQRPHLHMVSMWLWMFSLQIHTNAQRGNATETNEVELTFRVVRVYYICNVQAT